MFDNLKLTQSIRSFVRREGRLTAGQVRALTTGWPRYGLDVSDQIFTPAQLFSQPGRRILEIGFGDGESLVTQAAVLPNDNFVGVEVHRPGVGHLLHEIAARSLNNVRVVCEDMQVLLPTLPDQTFDVVQIYFSDPWQKRRHSKRRLIQVEFINALTRIIKPGGYLLLATDWQDYADHMQTVLAACPQFSVGSRPLELTRPMTKFERKGIAAGRIIHDFCYVSLGHL